MATTDLDIDAAIPPITDPAGIPNRIAVNTVVKSIRDDAESGGGGGGDLLAANNLSDVASVSTSRSNLGVDPAGTDNSVNVTLTGLSYLGLSGQQITLNAISLTSHVSGVLPIANMATGTPDGTKFVRDDGTLAVPAGGGTAAYLAILVKVGAYTILSADAFKLLECDGTFQLDLPTSFAAIGNWIDIINKGTGVITIAAGTDGINRAGNDVFTITQDQQVRLTYANVADPKWRADITTGQTLAANEYPAANASGNASEARLDVRSFFGTILDPTARTITLDPKTRIPYDVDEVELKVNGSSTPSITVDIKDDGVSLTNFPVVVTTNDTITVADAIAVGSEMTMVLSAISGVVDEITWSVKATRTAT